MRIILLASIVWTSFFSCSEKKEIQVSRPNIVFILADDLGYGEVGYQGQEKIKTPTIDALAATGKIFTNHYTAAPVCAPARC
jgi:arylsulfatase